MIAAFVQILICTAFAEFVPFVLFAIILVL